MGNNLSKAIVSLILPAIFLAGTPVFAQDLTLQDLGVEQAGILPSNPFYFFKSWGRSIRQTFTFAELSRAELQLDILNEQAAEVKKLSEINPDKLEGFERAVKNYIDSATALKLRLVNIKPSAGNAKFLDLLLDRALKHKEILDGLLGRFKGSDSYKSFYALVLTAEDKLIDVVAVIPGNIEDAKSFRDRFQSAVVKQKGELREFIASEFIDQLELKVKKEVRDELLKLKDSLLLRWAGRLRGLKAAISTNKTEGASIMAATTENQTLDSLGNFPGDASRRLKVLDEAREKIADIAIKNNINVIRQHILDVVREEGGATKDATEFAIKEAESLIADVEARIPVSGELRSTVIASLERAKFNLNIAKDFYEDESYGSAYGPALASGAAAKNALSSLVVRVTDLSDELKSIKQYFDALIVKAKEADLSEITNPKIFALAKNAESQIVRLADLISDGSDSPKATTALRELKATLSSIEQLIEEAIKFNAVPTDISL